MQAAALSSDAGLVAAAAAADSAAALPSLSAGLTPVLSELATAAASAGSQGGQLLHGLAVVTAEQLSAAQVCVGWGRGRGAGQGAGGGVRHSGAHHRSLCGKAVGSCCTGWQW